MDFLSNPNYRNNAAVRNVFNQYIFVFDNGAELNSGFFEDENGPIIPPNFRPFPHYRATHNSIAWLGINITCVRSGGKTRKNKKQKKTKKRNSRILKKRKSIKRKIMMKV